MAVKTVPPTPNSHLERSLYRLLNLTNELRKISPEIGAQTVATFLMVSLHPGKATVTDIQNWLGLTLASASRNVRMLSTREFQGKPGLGLIDYRQDMTDFRRRTLVLTDAGHSLVNAMFTALEG